MKSSATDVTVLYTIRRACRKMRKANARLLLLDLHTFEGLRTASVLGCRGGFGRLSDQAWVHGIFYVDRITYQINRTAIHTDERSDTIEVEIRGIELPFEKCDASTRPSSAPGFWSSVTDWS